GRPDLAGRALARVRAPTLLIVGAHDPVVIELNRQALAELRCEKQHVLVPGATHLFEEPGALERVAELARDWFERYLGSARGAGRCPRDRRSAQASAAWRSRSRTTRCPISTSRGSYPGGSTAPARCASGTTVATSSSRPSPVS